VLSYRFVEEPARRWFKRTARFLPARKQSPSVQP
jgi:peptidoglycan/LPS O-acetylase OafA/YrhL